MFMTSAILLPLLVFTVAVGAHLRPTPPRYQRQARPDNRSEPIDDGDRPPTLRHLLVYLGTFAGSVADRYREVLDQAGIVLDPERVYELRMDSNPQDDGSGSRLDVKFENLSLGHYQDEVEAGRLPRLKAHLRGLSKLPRGIYEEARQLRPVGALMAYQMRSSILAAIRRARQVLADDDQRVHGDRPPLRQYVVTIVLSPGGGTGSGAFWFILGLLVRVFPNVRVQVIRLAVRATDTDSKADENANALDYEIERHYGLTAEGKAPVVFTDEDPRLARHVPIHMYARLEGRTGGGSSQETVAALTAQAAAHLYLLTMTPMGYQLLQAQINRPRVVRETVDGRKAMAFITSIGHRRLRFDAPGIERRLTARQAALAAAHMLNEDHREATELGDLSGLRALVQAHHLSAELGMAPIQKWHPRTRGLKARRALKEYGEATSDHVLAVEDGIVPDERRLGEIISGAVNDLIVTVRRLVARGVPVGTVRVALNSLEKEITRPEESVTDAQLVALEERRLSAVRKKPRGWRARLVNITNQAVSLKRSVKIEPVAKRVRVAMQEAIRQAKAELAHLQQELEHARDAFAVAARPRTQKGRIVGTDTMLTHLNTPDDDDRFFLDLGQPDAAEAARQAVQGIQERIMDSPSELTAEMVMVAFRSAFEGRFTTVLEHTVADHLPRGHDLERLMERLRTEAAPRLALKPEASKRSFEAWLIPAGEEDLRGAVRAPGDRVHESHDPYEIVVMRSDFEIDLEGIDGVEEDRSQYDPWTEEIKPELHVVCDWLIAEEDRLKYLYRAVLVGIVYPTSEAGRYWREMDPRHNVPVDDEVRAVSWDALEERYREDDQFHARVQRALQWYARDPARLRKWVRSSLQEIDQRLPGPARSPVRHEAFAWLDGELSGAFDDVNEWDGASDNVPFEDDDGGVAADS